jgi:hypothetical protein
MIALELFELGSQFEFFHANCARVLLGTIFDPGEGSDFVDLFLG